MSLTWVDCTETQRNEIVSNAQVWYLDHREHVDGVVGPIQRTTSRVAPSGSDLFRPDLWKAAHWAWFLTGGVPWYRIEVSPARPASMQALYHACMAHKEYGGPVEHCPDCSFDELVKMRVKR